MSIQILECCKRYFTRIVLFYRCVLLNFAVNDIFSFVCRFHVLLCDHGLFLTYFVE